MYNNEYIVCTPEIKCNGGKISKLKGKEQPGEIVYKALEARWYWLIYSLMIYTDVCWNTQSLSRNNSSFSIFFTSQDHILTNTLIKITGFLKIFFQNLYHKNMYILFLYLTINIPSKEFFP